MRPRSLFFFVTLLALPLLAREVDVRPAPSWVETIDVDTTLAAPKQNMRWGLYDLLFDHQIHAGDGTETQYYRTVRSVLSSSGVQNASELELDFDPSFQRLVLHHAWIIRGAYRIDALEPDEIRVIEKEDESDNRIYDGERTALIFLRDVRPGDVIDYAWSLEGANPILGGRFTDELDLSSGVPTRRLRHRLVWPANRPLQWRGGEPVILADDTTKALVWERRNVQALNVEDELPSWYEAWDSVQVTDYTSWSEVAQWANAMFVLDERSRTAVKDLAATLSSQYGTRETRTTAAIRFVQDDIRYLGIEMGRNSHEPHQPWETLESRWGDCKDKTLLLVALLRELGVEAHPAFVNTRLQQRLADKLPSPFLFDHVIAQVVDGGQTYWVDGTISDQGGTLATIETPNDSLALVVSDASRELTRVVTNDKGGVFVDQTYTTTDYRQPTQLTVRTTYKGADADAVRSELASISLEDYAHARINDLALDQPKIEAVGLPLVADDRMRNVVVVTAQYRVPELWKDGHWSWYPRVIGAQLTRPDTMIRSMPLAFTHPLNVQQTATFNFPEAMAVEKSSSVTETPAFRYDYTIDSNGKTVTIRQTLRSHADHVPVKDVPDHLTNISSIWSEMGFRLSPEGATAPAAEAETPIGNWAAGLIVVATFVGVCWMLATRRRTVPVMAMAGPAFAFSPGEAPASAVLVSGADDIDVHLAERVCGCGAAHYSSPEYQRARYADRDLTIVTRHCAGCGKEQSLYFTAA